MTLLEVRGVRIQHDSDGHGETGAFTPDGVTFAVAPGEVVLLLGPSGCGKSTLALALNGLIPHAVPATIEGSVLVAGVDTATTTVAELSRTVGMVFQDPDAQIVTGTLLDEVCFGPENLLVAKDEVLARAERSLKAVGLWERRAENPDRLSGGGRQRLAIACALALESSVIVLDEPTANLDPAGIDEVYAVLAELVASGDRSIVLVEHNLDAAMDLVDRVVVMDASGRLVLDGPARATIVAHATQLIAMGVWLPVATLAALRLRESGIAVEPLPLTPRELAVALEAVEPPSVVELVETPIKKRVSTSSTTGMASSTTGVAISVKNLTVTKSRTEILRRVNLTVNTGDFLAIVGVNGAGKTTLLQALAGVVAPPRGTITTGGVDPATADVRLLAKSVGFVFQNPEHQFIRTTVAEELAHGLELQGVERREIDERVEEMLERFGLLGLRDVHPFLLSGGQKRRLSVGTALIAGAPILALDEPTFGQDRERAAELLDILAELNGAGTTVVVVTHDMQLVADYATHVAVMRGGEIIEHATADVILAGDSLEKAGLRPPPLARAMREVPAWRSISRMADLP